MTDSKYKCTGHYVDPEFGECHGCIEAHIATKEKLLEFVKDWSMQHISELELQSMENFDSDAENFQIGRNNMLADIILVARELLKEIGEL